MSISYHTPYKPETPILALGSSALWQIWVSRVDMGCDMTIAKTVKVVCILFKYKSNLEEISVL
jgi:hypothetical protein